jgi:hypothetical protein
MVNIALFCEFFFESMILLALLWKVRGMGGGRQRNEFPPKGIKLTV